MCMYIAIYSLGLKFQIFTVPAKTLKQIQGLENLLSNFKHFQFKVTDFQGVQIPCITYCFMHTFQMLHFNIYFLAIL